MLAKLEKTLSSSTIQHNSQFIQKIFTSVLQHLHRPRNTVTVSPISAERFEPKIRPILKTTPPPALPKFESKKIDYDRSPKQKVRDLILNIHSYHHNVVPNNRSLQYLDPNIFFEVPIGD